MCLCVLVSMTRSVCILDQKSIHLSEETSKYTRDYLRDCATISSCSCSSCIWNCNNSQGCFHVVLVADANFRLNPEFLAICWLEHMSILVHRRQRLENLPINSCLYKLPTKHGLNMVGCCSVRFADKRNNRQTTCKIITHILIFCPSQPIQIISLYLQE